MAFQNSRSDTSLLSGGARGNGGLKESRTGAPLVSIITIVLNGRYGIRKTIDSVLGQSYDNIEYIVIDGGSTDGTIELLRSYENRIDYWTSGSDQGISDGFNKGISLARGEIVGIINCEDWFEPDTVRTVVDTFLSTDADMVHGKMQLWDIDKKSELLSADFDLVHRGMTLNHPTLFVKRKCYEKFGHYRLDFHCSMDYEWILRVKSRGVKAVYIDTCLANMTTGGVSSRFWRKAFWEVLRAQQIHNPRIANYFLWLWQNVKGATGRSLGCLGMRWAIRYYHEHFSAVKKEWRDS